MIVRISIWSIASYRDFLFKTKDRNINVPATAQEYIV